MRRSMQCMFGHLLSRVPHNDVVGVQRQPRYLVPQCRVLLENRWTGTRSKHHPTSVTEANHKKLFAGTTSATYIEGMYKAWLLDPKSVNASWDIFFKNHAAGASAPGTGHQAPPTLHQPANSEVVYVWPNTLPAAAASADEAAGTAKAEFDGQLVNDYFTVLAMINAYQTRGHYAARTDPLLRSTIDLDHYYKDAVLYRGTSPFVKFDLERVYKLPPTTLIGGKDDALPLKEILKRLDTAYCGSIGVEYMHVDPELRDWIRERVEVPGRMGLDEKEKVRVLNRIMMATGFESFLARKWSSEKRFGLEGCEVLIPALKEIIDQCSGYGVNVVFLGMAHRGRLNVLANVCQKPLNTIFMQFHGLEAEDVGSGDVKYHLGTSGEHVNEMTGKNVRTALVANPSHLEAVGAVVQGKTRAEQFFRNDVNGNEVMSILIHGDSSISGQGVVYETFHLSDLLDYTTHGTIHVVVNNQIGFTTDPPSSKSSHYCTDVAKVVNAPVFHINADDPEAVMHVCKIAAEWRSTFKKDVVIDIVGYRRNGHNEVDEPMFTQPHMYRVIKDTTPVYNKYAELLVKEKVVTKEEVDKSWDDYQQVCEKAFTVSTEETRVRNRDWLDSPWPGFFRDKSVDNYPKTGVKEDTLVHIGNLFSSVPANDKDEFVIHKGLERIFKNRQLMIRERTVDWALAEAMSFGSLLKDGVHVRLSGQDVERGTFSHRHHVLHNQKVGKSTYRPLCDMYPDQAKYTVCNSSLSEFAVLGFELGFSMTNPNALVCWEAQFGDFNNTAQCIIDQFISSGQAKWVRQSGLVMLLPHAYEGMGPEHSSARLERFLQMSSDDPDVLPEKDENFAVRQLNATNWIVANCSTPANYFHALRRQVSLSFRKPLIMMTPKSLLRHPDAKSSFDEMIENTEFVRLIPENGPASKNVGSVKRLIFCSGKVYYDLIQSRGERNLQDAVAISRVEQISPFPFDLVNEESTKYENADVVWVQEEPKNQGAWSYVQPRFLTAFSNTKSIHYVGRPVAASPATGNKVQHSKEIQNFLDKSFAV